ncbi:YggS family pyridoxal phosphate-dependent enzyme [Enterococcus sp. LJL98]
MISENLLRVRQEIQNSCALVSRQPEEVKLIAVTKSVDSQAMKELHQQGINDFAENRTDVFLEKYEQFKDDPTIKWHFIGHLQRRKVKQVINQMDYFHALESLKLAQEIQKRATKTISCFVEVNVSGEASKMGISPDELLTFIQALQPYDKIKVIGLMTMAPYESDEAEQFAIFSKLRSLQQEVVALQAPAAPCQELSMGMSNDFSVAIQAGATSIRVGSALFQE